MTFNFQIFLKKRNIIIIWILAGLISAIKQYFLGETNSHLNNYIIFKTSFYHLLDHLNLYLEHPKDCLGLYLYGPIFAILIAPFSILPTLLGYALWNILNAGILLYAIYQLPISDKDRALVSWISLNCLITSLLNSQFHAICVALIILSYTFIHKKQFFWAAFFLVLGVSIKLYGIVGLAFFFFVEDKLKYILYCVFWTIVLFTLPMIFVGIDYIFQCYVDWYQVLVDKNFQNTILLNTRTDVCVMGMFRRVFHNQTLSNLYFIIPGLIVFALSYLRFSQFKNIVFQLRILASALIFIILASTGSESPTIIIGFVGVAIWYLLSGKTTLDKVILWFALIISSFSPTDVFPRYIREEYINQYALMVLPLIFVWLKLNWDIALANFNYQKKNNLDTVIN